MARSDRTAPSWGPATRWGGRIASVLSFGLLIAGCDTRPRVVTSSALSDAGALTGRQTAAGGAEGSAGNGGAEGSAGNGGAGAGQGSAGTESAGSSGGGAAGSGETATDACVGMTCEAPPAAACADTSTLRVHAAVGDCIDGACVYSHVDTACGFGCENASCAEDPCLGVTCTAPPPSRCSDGEHLEVHDAIGSCEAGECAYTSRVLSCACADDACITDPCPSITCDMPPSAFCPNPTTRRTFAAAGTCSAGSCSYAPSDTACEFGCSNGACNPDPCYGVTCTMPPLASCPTPASRRSYASPGTCNGGTCSYTPTTTNCRANEVCTAGACVPDPTKCLAGITDYASAGPFSYDTPVSGAVKLWVPAVPNGCKVPVVHVANGTGAACSTYQNVLIRLATHGFLAACYEATNTGAGQVGLTAIETAYSLYPDLADTKIGSAGHSQGGQAAIVTLHLAEAKWGSARTYAGFSIMPASGFGEQPTGGTWEEIYARVESPVFIMSGSSDTLVSEAWVQRAFDALSSEVEAYWFSAAGAVHIPPPDSHIQPGAVSWFRWKLLGDAAACNYFKGLPETGTWDPRMQKNAQPCP